MSVHSSVPYLTFGYLKFGNIAIPPFCPIVLFNNPLKKAFRTLSIRYWQKGSKFLKPVQPGPAGCRNFWTRPRRVQTGTDHRVLGSSFCHLYCPLTPLMLSFFVRWPGRPQPGLPLGWQTERQTDRQRDSGEATWRPPSTREHGGRAETVTSRVRLQCKLIKQYIAVWAERGVWWTRREHGIGGWSGEGWQ